MSLSISNTFSDWLNERSVRFSDYFTSVLPNSDYNILHRAIRYSALGGGKCLRPALIYGCAEELGIDEHIDALAASLEAVHAYSLIHDDLPAMDDDDLRRGKASCHVAFGEGQAILAGDALQTWAFENIAMQSIDSEIKIELILLLSKAIGPNGMATGQSIDIQFELDHTNASIENLCDMHRKKTGLLIQTAILMPIILTQQTKIFPALKKFGEDIGLAFQIHDDILDETASTSQLGKPANSDIDKDKLTFTRLLGTEESIVQRDYYFNSAYESLCEIGWEKSRLLDLALYMTHRSN